VESIVVQIIVYFCASTTPRALTPSAVRFRSRAFAWHGKGSARYVYLLHNFTRALDMQTRGVA